ncbi:TonB-dependent receptor [Acinetobacter nosocomialis]|uniref:TonB-dependent siderophore receptor n=1 Tax=Acinetobacter calcoaceticus/baumannii complex TaxID=909768 RepID=UPI0004F5650C|nr:MULTISPECIES: TonB-dependent siderophore receptor [Acinetobacter calcoaceticus/baumannii complex]AJB48312.1 TonB-dependent receptor [Acinetobacter nosocomialis]MBJ9960867.1 TonB-dependent siderophore receptor [Acinetobacter nosocomialis]MBR7738542.1 TonB-dependent siderophore receptor [Acinetobacter nosocomialis]MBR7748924.1 TonB-dependent siderophore receptor [Acinetobacter nosocomialis]MDO7214521.1 TonB-dependent siderophore receptor [Acinetobacter nosocomialis]
MLAIAGNYSMERRSLNLHFMTCSKTALASSIALITSVVYANEVEVSQLPTITVNATQNNDALYSSKKVTLSGFQTDDVKKVPASITTITSERIADQHAKTLTDVIKNDSSLGDGYAAIGYYPNFVARGFALDLGSSYLINGHTIRGEQNVALENKEQVEILKGISAIQSGMSTPGGVVNYVTKRPADVKNITVDANSEGGYTLATDVGGFVNDNFGYRINLAHESIHPNVDHANGKREFGSVALDWKINDRSKLLFDIEAQHQSQRSVPGYQLLDGQEVPTNVDQDRLLGYQSWSKPVVNNSLNASLKYQYAFNDQWNGSLSASQSRVVIDDYVVFPYGSYYSSGNEFAVFDKDGNYDLYDYRSPDDTRITNQFAARLNGQFNTGNLQHHVTFELQNTRKNLKRYDPSNQLIENEIGNIYVDKPDFQMPTEKLGNRFKALESNQTAFTISDRVQFNDQWSTLLGGKLIHLDEQAYNSDGQQSRDTDLNKFLPQLALMYSPTSATNLYASYAKGLSDGGEAPWYAEANAYQVLSPRNSEQYELGVKQQIRNFLVTAAIFDLKQDNQYTITNSEGKLEFVEQGKQHNQGIELGLTGALTDTLDVSSGITFTKSRLVDIDTDSYKGHQTQNVPKVRATAQLSYKVPSVEGLRLLSGMQYSSSKYANKEGTAKVGGYIIFNIGAAYKTNFAGHDTTFRFNIDNLFNKKYWRDVGAFMGDDYLFLGNPRTAQFSTTFSF